MPMYNGEQQQQSRIIDLCPLMLSVARGPLHDDADYEDNNEVDEAAVTAVGLPPISVQTQPQQQQQQSDNIATNSDSSTSTSSSSLLMTSTCNSTSSSSSSSSEDEQLASDCYVQPSATQQQHQHHSMPKFHVLHQQPMSVQDYVDSKYLANATASSMPHIHRHHTNSSSSSSVAHIQPYHQPTSVIAKPSWYTQQQQQQRPNSDFYAVNTDSHEAFTNDAPSMTSTTAYYAPHPHHQLSYQQQQQQPYHHTDVPFAQQQQQQQQQQHSAYAYYQASSSYNPAAYHHHYGTPTTVADSSAYNYCA